MLYRAIACDGPGAADRIGNGWWLLMTEDLVDYSDIKTGKTGELKVVVDDFIRPNGERTVSLPWSSRQRK